MVTGVVPSSPRFLPSIFITHRVQQSHCSANFHRAMLTHALVLSASRLVHKKKSQRIYSSMHSAGLELTKLTYTRLEDNLIRHRGDRLYVNSGSSSKLPAFALLLCGMAGSGCLVAAPSSSRQNFQIISHRTQPPAGRLYFKKTNPQAQAKTTSRY